MECMNGELKDIDIQESLNQIIDRLVSNQDNWAINTKVLIILH